MAVAFGMRPLLLLVTACALAACVSPTEPWRDFHCLYPGDTVGVVEVVDTERVVTSCVFIVQKTKECADAINSRVLFRAKDCVVGAAAQG